MVAMVIIRKKKKTTEIINHLELFSEINMDAHRAKVRMRKRNEEEMQLLVVLENIRECELCVCIS